MVSLRSLLAAAALCSVLIGLPSTAHCNTSYYERYYSARRYQPLKKNSLLDFNFTVRLDASATVAGYEQMALVGDLKELGLWRATHAVLLNRTLEHNVWTGRLQLPLNTSVNYRYFVAAVDNATHAVQVRRWESHIEARHFTTGILGGNRTDTFGRMAADGAGDYEVQRGWLHSGRIVQLKMFRNPLKINDVRSTSERLRVKVQAIEPKTLTPILPSTRAHTEYVRMQYGNSFLRDQPEYGVPYEKDDIVIYHTTVSELEGVAYVVKVYSALDGSDLVRLIGYQYIYPSALVGSEGTLSVHLISPVWLYTIGSLELKYLIMTPLVNATVDFRTSFVDYWRTNWTCLDVGHRGLGKSLKQLTHVPASTENTLASMKASAELGADMVEFDVQLTSDLVPIIYHDYVIYVCMDPKKPKTREDLTEVHIKDVTYEALKNLKTYQMVGTKIIEYPAHNNVLVEDQRLFPSFEDFLTKLNRSLGFDIEIKWPQEKRIGGVESPQTIDKNTYVDRILEVMLQHGCGRLSFFSCFDADILTLLRFKQNMYPAMFLSSSKMGNYADPRSDSITDTVNNAQAFDLAGIVPNSALVRIDASWLSLAMRQRKKVFLWGDAIKDVESIEWFKQQGATGLIYDRLDLWLPVNKKSAFEMEMDLPAFFQRQCEPLTASATTASGAGALGGNSTTDGSLSNVNLL